MMVTGVVMNDVSAEEVAILDVFVFSFGALAALAAVTRFGLCCLSTLVKEIVMAVARRIV